ncbi:MAG: hypothetical protein IPL53_12805 [Ignavibacteria bacterium]|nr:hypothetical protein [Ignavibacteria bacterium]
MRHVIRVFLPLIVIIVFVNLYFAHPDGIQPIDNYPIWMKGQTGSRTDQTSGLCYVGESDGKKVFISADDIGKINRLTIDERIDPPDLEINEIAFSEEVKSLFQKFKKKDMEDITFDKLNNKILLSIEGHEYSSLDPQIYRKKEGIYEITFNKDILTFDSILTIKRLNLPEEVYRHTFDNIGFEGFAATDNYFFLGLENYQVNGTEFSDSTILYIANRKTNEVKTIGTRDLKISTICGLYATDDHTIYGIDRNRRSMFYIKFNEDFTVNKSEIMEMSLPIPFHKEIDMIVGIAPESITFDDEGNIYVAIDPWQNFYKPDIASKKKLSDAELKNFYEGVPIMYKYKNMFN